MHKHCILLFALLFILGHVSAFGDPTARCEVISATSKCKTYVRNPNAVFVVDSFNQTAMEAQITQLFTYLPYLGTGCNTDANKKLICQGIYGECLNVTVNGNNVALFNRPCYADCSTTNTACNNQYNCTKNITAYNVREFPPVSNVFDLSTLGGISDYTVQCLPESQSGTTPPVNPVGTTGSSTSSSTSTSSNSTSSTSSTSQSTTTSSGTPTTTSSSTSSTGTPTTTSSTSSSSTGSPTSTSSTSSSSTGSGSSSTGTDGTNSAIALSSNIFSIIAIAFASVSLYLF